MYRVIFSPSVVFLYVWRSVFITWWVQQILHADQCIIFIHTCIISHSSLTSQCTFRCFRSYKHHLVRLLWNNFIKVLIISHIHTYFPLLCWTAFTLFGKYTYTTHVPEFFIQFTSQCRFLLTWCLSWKAQYAYVGVHLYTFLYFSSITCFSSEYNENISSNVNVLFHFGHCLSWMFNLLVLYLSVVDTDVAG